MSEQIITEPTTEQPLTERSMIVVNETEIDELNKKLEAITNERNLLKERLEQNETLRLENFIKGIIGRFINIQDDAFIKLIKESQQTLSPEEFLILCDKLCENSNCRAKIWFPHIEQTNDLCKIIIKRNGWYTFETIKEQNEELCLEALKNCSDYVNYDQIHPAKYIYDLIKNKTKAIKILAATKCPEILVSIERTIDKTLESGENSEAEFDEICRLIVKKRPSAIKHIMNQKDDICQLALDSATSDWDKANVYSYFKNQTHELNKYIIQLKPSFIKEIKNQTDEDCWFALNLDTNAIHGIVNPTTEMAMYCIEKNYIYIKSIKRPTIAMIKIAFKQNADALKHITTEQLAYALIMS